MRAICGLEEDQEVFRSRKNKIIDWLEGIKKELKVFFHYLPSHSRLDGELYTFSLPFEELMSAVRTKGHEHPDNFNTSMVANFFT
jgi:hypothetical protein